MWIYRQSTGAFLYPSGQTFTVGYSGAPATGKNNPAMQAEHNVGPIPCGVYDIAAPEDIDGGPHGPYVLPLLPRVGNQMFGRDGFLIHDDSLHHPGAASQGCIVTIGQATRQAIWESGDHVLQVIP